MIWICINLLHSLIEWKIKFINNLWRSWKWWKMIISLILHFWIWWCIQVCTLLSHIVGVSSLMHYNWCNSVVCAKYSTWSLMESTSFTHQLYSMTLCTFLVSLNWFWLVCNHLNISTFAFQILRFLFIRYHFNEWLCNLFDIWRSIFTWEFIAILTVSHIIKGS